MVVIMVIIPKLGLKEQTDGELVDYAANKVLKLTNNVPFAAVDPTALAIKGKNDAFILAVAKALKGSEQDTREKNTLRKELEEMLTLQASDCALIAGDDTVLFGTTGYQAKDTKGSPTGELVTPENILFRKYGNTPGQLIPDWDSVEDAKNYTVQVYTDINNPAGTLVKEVMVSPSKATINDLPTGTIVYVRVRANGGSTGHSPWSDPAQKRVP